jgi:hypothetical protein
MDQNQELSGQMPPGNMAPGAQPSQAGEIKVTQQPASLQPQPQQEMEVHHHAHGHAKKTAKEYLFDFLMLFLAVVLGFLAESWRESLEDAKKERKYIQSMMVDIETDYTLSDALQASIGEQIQKIDTLQGLLLTTARYSQADVVKCYELTGSLLRFYPEFFYERTTTQLLSSGNMRLIHNQHTADSIMGYHNYIKFIEIQRQLYINAMNSCSQSMYDVFDISLLKSIPKDGQLYYPLIDPAGYRLREVSDNELKRFIAILENAKLIAANYNKLLADMSGKSNRLYEFLNEEYHINPK